MGNWLLQKVPPVAEKTHVFTNYVTSSTSNSPLEFSKVPRYHGKVTFLHLGLGGLLALIPKEFSRFWISQWCINGASSPTSRLAPGLGKIIFGDFFRFWPRIAPLHKENWCFVKIISIYDPFSSSRARLRQFTGGLLSDMSAKCAGVHPAQILRPQHIIELKILPVYLKLMILRNYQLFPLGPFPGHALAYEITTSATCWPWKSVPYPRKTIILVILILSKMQKSPLATGKVMFFY